MAASTDSASLVIRVDATETTKGAEALDKLTVSAEGASKSVDNLAKSEEDAKARIKAMVQASMEKVQAQNASIASGQREVQMTDAQRAALDKLNATSNTQADMNARGAAILAAEERTRKAATVTIAE
jgi:hypothetical protein